ncbi:hypothetical protein LA304_02060 [Celeribacter sp. ASW11-22]|nr:hypothetical protein [Celeribacter litoreus]
MTFDRERLDQLYAELGRSGADDVISKAMEELAVRLAKVGNAHKKGDFPQVQKSARSMIAISDQIGMVTLARVAGAVNELAQSGDYVALAACVSRLVRIGENSLLAIWDHQGASL